ncbi:phenylalanine--tRNA ligase subunit beta [soil metagenome]
MPTITVKKDDLYRLANLDVAYKLATLDDELALVKGELNARTLDGQSLRSTAGVWVDDAVNYALRIELKDTNRPDLWSVEGIARHLRDHARGYGADYAFFTRDTVASVIEVDAQLASIRPYIGGFLARGGNVDEDGLLAFIETQETLTRNFGRKRKTISIGLYHGADIVFPVRYGAVGRAAIKFEPLAPATQQTAWPVGVAMTPQTILEQHPTGREYAAILDGFSLVPMLTDATGAVLSFPPIINSANLGRVTPGMTTLFVEATGAELDQCLLTLNILATNLADRGWMIEPVTTRYPYATPRGRLVTAPYAMALTQQVALAEFGRLLGETVCTEDVVAKLMAYGVAATAVDEQITAIAPSYRQDYLHPVDVIEDYAISRGYATFAPAMPADFTVGKLQPLTDFEDLTRDLMIGFGFEEAICNILTNLEQLRERMAVSIKPDGARLPFHGGPAVAIENVMNLNYSHLRDWLLPSLLEAESSSAGALYPHKIFEVGEVAVFDLTQNLGSRTESRLAGIIADEAASFDAVQSVLYALLVSLDITFKVEPWVHPAFIEGRVARLTTQLATQDAPIELGFLGELSPQVLTNWGARVPVAVFELSLDTLANG